jgi:hypothetical protein
MIRQALYDLCDTLVSFELSDSSPDFGLLTPDFLLSYGKVLTHASLTTGSSFFSNDDVL